METKTLIISAVAVLALSIVSNVLINRHMQAKQLELIINTLRVPTIMTIDMDKTVSELMEAGLKPEEVLAHIDNINKAMRVRNVLLLDKQAAIAIPDNYKLEQVTTERLAKFLTDNGVAPSEASGFERNLQEAAALLNFTPSN